MTELNTRPNGDRWLLVGNLITLVLALRQGWSLTDLLLPFWLQSVAIGVLQAIRMMRLKSFSTEGFTSNGKRVPETPAAKRSTVWFFAAHYGAFHLFYLFFIVGVASQEYSAADAAVFVPGTGRWYLACVAALVFAEIAAHRDDVRRDASGKPNLGLLMFLPYLRVVPMHLMIFIGGTFGSSSVSVIAFVSMKTASDWLMQFCERKIEQGGKKSRST